MAWRNIQHSRGHCDVFFELPSFPQNAYIFVDAHVHAYWKDFFLNKEVFIIPAGENAKTFDQYLCLLNFLEKQLIDRETEFYAIGGGATLDAIGFLASTYLRGITWHAVPTTLLAMVDACIGGKVGVNLNHHKNRIGHFHPPKSVWVDLQWCESLPKREFQSGFAEILKTLALTSQIAWQRRDNLLSLDLLKECIAFKANIVEKDEFEKDSTMGRYKLNAGHTLGHALESLYPGKYLHGEAVAIGLCIESKFGVEMGITDCCFYQELLESCKKQGLPVELPVDASISNLVSLMQKDKKSLGSNINISMISVPGECKLITVRPQEMMDYLSGEIIKH